MKLIHEDYVDWEPLEMRFVVDDQTTTEQKRELAEYIVEWMTEREAADRQKWHFCEYHANATDPNVVEAFCELMPSDEVANLAKAVESRFTFAIELRLGHKIDGRHSHSDVDWYHVPGRDVTIDGITYLVSPFDISFTQVTLGQFSEFIAATKYVPVPDRINNYPNYTIRNFTINYGTSPKTPLYGLTFDDALAFCDWTGHRLPTDPELRLFFETISAQKKRKLNWTGDNWTSTPAGENMYVVRDGPFHPDSKTNPDPYRKPLDRNHYEHLEAPSFRIVRVQ